jgi:hypothetical protein
MCGDDLGVAHVPTPVETGDIILLERGEYRVLDVIPSRMSSPRFMPSYAPSPDMYDPC